MINAGSVMQQGNIYPREYARGFYEGQKANGQEDVLNLVRCAWAGSQQYGALIWDLDTQYMFGPDILAAPIVEPHSFSRKVYLPQGSSWTNAHTGEILNGGQWIEAEASIDTLPVFLRDGRQEYLVKNI